MTYLDKLFFNDIGWVELISMSPPFVHLVKDRIGFRITLCSSTSLFFFCVLLLGAQAQEASQIRIGQSSLTDVQVASIVTARAGIFKKYGLAPELIALQGGPQTIQALIANSIHFADMPGTAVINSRVAGANIVSILYHLIGVT